MTGNLKIYVQNTSDVANNKSTTWATAITGMTKVFDGTATVPNANGAYTVNLPSTFQYTDDNLYIAYEFAPAATAPFAAVYYCNTSLSGGIKSGTGSTSPTTVSSSSFRPIIVFGVVGLTEIKIKSNNANTATATFGDEVTLDFTADQAIKNVSATIGGKTATVTNPSGNIWQAKLTLDNTVAMGALPFEISYELVSTAGPTKRTTTTDNSVVTVFNVLPVGFKGMQAKISSGQLLVDWQTLSERDNSHFIIDYSLDGKKWTELAKVRSKASDGNSSVAIDYHFNTPVSGLALAGLGLLALLFMPAARNRFIRGASLLLVLAFAASCAKETQTDLTLENAVKDKSNPVYIRLTQVDRDGSSQVLATTSVRL